MAIGWIARHPLAPLENECFVVQSNGMAQWLKLAMADDEGCGISAAVDFQLPARFLWNAYRAVLGDDEIPDHSPFDKDRLIWRLMRLLPTWIGSDWFTPLANYLSDDPDHRKRYQLSRHLADLYDQYQVYRADWLSEWIHGSDRLYDAGGIPIDLPPEQRWQAELWRYIHADVPENARDTSRFRLHRRFLDEIGNCKTRPPLLPRRVIVFGISSLPQQAIAAIHALSRHSQILLFVHNPCRHFWADIVEDRQLLRIHQTRHRQKAGLPPSLNLERLHQHVNPLLAAWGKQGRDYIGLLYGYDRPEKYRGQFGQIDLFSDFIRIDAPHLLLHQVQQAILDLTPLPGSEGKRDVISPDDRSITFQVAHSRQREVEILRDQLLALFDDDAKLSPQDVIVMTPDIDLYTSHVEAVFGNVDVEDARHIPYTIADSPERAGAALFKALDKLFHLPTLRLSAGDLLDLLMIPAVRHRFGWEEGDLPQLHDWIFGSGIRWGLCAEHRRSLGLPEGIEQNTWWFGVKRMLLGYAVGKGECWREIVPFDEIGGLDAALIGPLVQMIQRLEAYRQTLARPSPPEDWARRLGRLLHDFFLPADAFEQLAVTRMETVIDEWLEACADADLRQAIPLAVVREALMGAMERTSVSQRFLAGRVNFCTLMPMRAIPFKVVCLLGMDDGAYPRSRPPMDFDLMAGAGRYRPGDRSRREDDRYIFLEALLSAREKLYISYVGRNIRDNSRLMPSVLVGQLKDYLAAGWQVAKDRNGRQKNLLDQLTCEHPLQPFSQTYFQPERWPERFTYARKWQGIHGGKADKPSIPVLKPAMVEGKLKLAPLIQFLKNPVRAFFNQRLKVNLSPVDVITEDTEPFFLDALAPFDMGTQLLAAGFSARPEARIDTVHRTVEILKRSGRLPINGFGKIWADSLAEPVLRILDMQADLSSKWKGEPETVELRLFLPLGGGEQIELEDWLDGLQTEEAGQPESKRFARWEFYPLAIMDAKGEVSRLHPLIGPWLKHLSACAAGLDLTSCLIAPDGVATLAPLPPVKARRWLSEIAIHWFVGLATPLPVTARSALAYLTVVKGEDGQRARHAAQLAFQGDGFNRPGELGYGDGVYLRRCYPDFDALWQADDNRFDDLARRLYGPIVEHIG